MSLGAPPCEGARRKGKQVFAVDDVTPGPFVCGRAAGAPSITARADMRVSK